MSIRRSAYFRPEGTGAGAAGARATAPTCLGGPAVAFGEVRCACFTHENQGTGSSGRCRQAKVHDVFDAQRPEVLPVERKPVIGARLDEAGCPHRAEVARAHSMVLGRAWAVRPVNLLIVSVITVVGPDRKRQGDASVPVIRFLINNPGGRNELLQASQELGRIELIQLQP